ncbi:hypothetical protein NECAME_05235 [Necator americanus]|uniref:Uncharacterized protein n=1 Tax=Necator americanus TaxID=51031 RepID=W2SLA3_NECAM|nr:hypothetical protein NECAME_05235 [Necator americanus]ETN69522.1 hypothetical protein NECAME_05235 [Necator americanus]
MVAPFLKYFFYRGVLPLSLLFAAFVRPCFMSVGYVIFALLSPVLPSIHAAMPLPGGICMCCLWFLLGHCRATIYLDDLNHIDLLFFEGVQVFFSFLKRF